MGWLTRFRQFVSDVWVEMKKTTWPSGREVYGTTLVVIITVLICAVYLFVVDKILESGMTYLFRFFGR